MTTGPPFVLPPAAPSAVPPAAPSAVRPSAPSSVPATTSPILSAPPVLQTLDGQGQVWEYDLGDRPAASAPAPTPDQPGGNESSGWAADLDQADGWIDEGGKAEPGSPRRRRLALVAATALAVLVAALSVPSLLSADEETTDDNTVVLGRHLTAPVALNLPDGAIATADESYVGVQFATGGWVLVTVPEQVVQPDGTRAEMPSNPSAWLQRHPDVFVSAVRRVEVDGRPATQIDYRRSSMAQPQSSYARLPLFCGWRGEDVNEPGGNTSVFDAGSRPSTRECTQITDGARVRATFIPVEGRTLLVEAVWRPYGVWGWRMPTTLRDSYNGLLAGLSPRPAGS
ncbi:hypothetical protein KIH74_18160 [Kineosporia sp. J2-2]|uniref:Uncharacterized protein n=1 Tax=Kineosporia corallincola TaxID=2835133 RepID=A0ABS5TIG7_9ACTN|nr:hypothetical protein [Kineosporia corallincola]MBT0770870.1 hypothetical protein [Kineosporia corallincola]